MDEVALKEQLAVAVFAGRDMELFLKEVLQVKNGTFLFPLINSYCKKYNVPPHIRTHMHNIRYHRNLIHEKYADLSFSVDFNDPQLHSKYQQYYYNDNNSTKTATTKNSANIKTVKETKNSKANAIWLTILKLKQEAAELTEKILVDIQFIRKYDINDTLNLLFCELSNTNFPSLIGNNVNNISNKQVENEDVDVATKSNIINTTKIKQRRILKIMDKNTFTKGNSNRETIILHIIWCVIWKLDLHVCGTYLLSFLQTKVDLNTALEDPFLQDFSINVITNNICTAKKVVETLRKQLSCYNTYLKEVKAGIDTTNVRVILQDNSTISLQILQETEEQYLLCNKGIFSLKNNKVLLSLDFLK